MLERERCPLCLEAPTVLFRDEDGRPLDCGACRQGELRQLARAMERARAKTRQAGGKS